MSLSSVASRTRAFHTLWIFRAARSGRGSAENVSRKIRKLSGAIVRDMEQSYRSASLEERAGLPVTYQKIRAKYDPDLQKLLTPEQFNWLKQIHWQTMGPNALADREVIKAVDISEQQLEKITAINRSNSRQAVTLLLPP